MSDVKWIKLSTHMFEDEKIRLIESMPEADTLLIIWIRLLAQAGKTNASGYIFLSHNIPYTEEMLATLFNRPISTVRLALQTFQQFGMIEVTEEKFICISNWEKHQNIDGLDKIREQTRLRVQRKRKRDKELRLELSRDSNVTVTQCYGTEEDKELEEEIDKDKEEKNSIPYTEIIQYLNEKASKSFNPKTEGHRKHIRARWNEGYTVENFKTVIDKKVEQWKDAFSQDGKPLSDYLRPSTLFSQKHFDNYLNESVKGGTNNAKAGEKGSYIDQYDF
ncbi:phage replisome organizer N-terminal domain-containing protein [Bacillus paramycoides]|uniref:phage replisome organizer N-terminal domain-containing protein n=1 Tax=Bacillus paramycoides TaxID=2026194 RepID=UPI002E1AB104|nr:phage replisome organizer N-terminal domain-containing protein [Bacillus paramycoides]